MQIELVHHVPGRMRVRAAQLRNWESSLNSALGHLLGNAGGRSFRVNSWCASVVVYYDAKSPDVVRRILGVLRRFSILSSVTDTIRQPLQPLRRRLQAGLEFVRRRHTFLWSSIALAVSLVADMALIVLAPLAIAALPSLTRAWAVLRRERRLNVDFLDILAILVSVGRAEFFTAAFMTWMINLGDWIRDKTANRSKRALAEMLQFQATNAWVLRRGSIVRVASNRVNPGDTVLVYPGEIVPVDGSVKSGRATVDQKTVTGESLPMAKATGDEVFASTVLHEGKLRICASRVGANTTAAQIVRLIESAPIGETRMQNYAEKFGDRLVAPMLLFSGALYGITGNTDRLLSMMIVDFGTGIRVAAPTSVLAGMTHAARHGILIKGGRNMEKLASVDTVVFDKTGTLTYGTPAIRDVISCDKRRFPPRKILALAAAAEARLKHPVSQALVAKAHAAGISIPERAGGKFEIGLGVEARINGYHVHVGCERFFLKKQIKVGALARTNEEAGRRGWSTLLFAVDGVLKGIIPYADVLRNESRSVVHSLRDTGIRRVVMITGDNGRIAKAVAEQSGIDECFAETLPANKAEIIKDLQKQGHVVGMVGDGINDSPALAYADVGIAMKHGADVARETAHVVLMEDNLWRLPRAIEISRKTMKTIRQNYGIIAGLNALALLLAIPAGLVSPNISALISNGSAILASLNAIRPVLND
jgi:heavy metal translocating P-type ATPase